VGPPGALVELLERIRGLSGEPLVILSGYRSLGTNNAVGGAANSRHLKGDAADIPRGRVQLEQAVQLGAVGCGLSGVWVTHVDVRPGPPVHWHY
jgi:uncharacterized protein YcbK (DUF882 family)